MLVALNLLVPFSKCVNKKVTKLLIFDLLQKINFLMFGLFALPNSAFNMFTSIFNTNTVLRYYIFYSTLLILKMMAMTLLTIKNRFSKGVFSSPEDGTYRKIIVKYDDPDVERVRRAHRNDMENIPLFVFLGLFYVATAPKPNIALNLFRTFTAARFSHTLVCTVFVLPQPARLICFFTGYSVLIYMAYSVMYHFY